MGPDLGSVGIWSLELRSPSAEVAEAAAELHEQGWGALWIAGATGPGLWADAERLLAAGATASVVLGVMSIWGEDAVNAAAEHARLRAAHGKRIVTGLGVSDPQAAASSGRPFRGPIPEMSAYLDALDAATPALPASERILGALGPRMVSLAGARTAGIHPFLVTPESNRRYRADLGPAALIAPHQAVVLESDPERARAIARRGIGMFIGFPSYRANLKRLGFDDADLVPGGSDRLIDAVVAWGDVETVAERIAAHHEAGADHVALHVLTEAGGLPRAEWRALASLAS